MAAAALFRRSAESAASRLKARRLLASGAHSPESGRSKRPVACAAVRTSWDSNGMRLSGRLPSTNLASPANPSTRESKVRAACTPVLASATNWISASRWRSTIGTARMAESAGERRNRCRSPSLTAAASSSWRSWTARPSSVLSSSVLAVTTRISACTRRRVICADRACWKAAAPSTAPTARMPSAASAAQRATRRRSRRRRGRRERRERRRRDPGTGAVVVALSSSSVIAWTTPPLPVV